MTLAGARPCLCFAHLTHLNVQLVIFDHPKTLCWLHRTAELLAEEGRVALDSHAHLVGLYLDIKLG